MHEKIEKWLNGYVKKRVKIQMKSRIANFLNSVGISEEELINMSPQEAEDLVISFQSKESDKGVPNNTILSIITAPRALFKYLRKPLVFRRGQLLSLEGAKNKHTYSNTDLQKMFEVADIRGKAIISLGSSLGWGISDVLKLGKEFISTLIKRSKEENTNFIFFNSQRIKTSAKSLGTINPLAIEWLERWLAINDSDRLFDINGSQINKELQRFAAEAQLDLTGSVSFHCFRSWVMSTLIESGFSEYACKYLVGKKIPLSDDTYLKKLEKEIREKYPKVYDKFLNISGTIKTIAVKDNAIKELEGKLQDTQNTVFSISSRLVTVENDYSKLKLGVVKILDYLQKTSTGINPKNIEFTMEQLCGILGVDIRQVTSTKQLEQMVLAK